MAAPTAGISLLHGGHEVPKILRMSSHRRVGNWVDRGEAPEAKIARVLSYSLGRDPADTNLAEWSVALRAMVEADANEVQVATYLGTLPGSDTWPGSTRRLLAIAIWHIAKSGLVRDTALRRIAELLPGGPPTESLSQFLERAISNAPDRQQYQPPPGAPKPPRR